MADPPVLVDQVADHLDREGVPFALIGAAALAVHGVSRSTLDIDLLVTDPRVLERAFWASFGGRAAIDIRTGDAADPLAGVVRTLAPAVHPLRLEVPVDVRVNVDQAGEEPRVAEVVLTGPDRWSTLTISTHLGDEDSKAQRPNGGEGGTHPPRPSFSSSVL